MSQQPWASGPSEILRHGLSLLYKDSDSNRRLAMLSIDNAVELTIKTYLGLPRRVTGINLSRKDYLEICESFPRLLDALEQHAAGKLDGINIAEIEWYHRLRNELYHQGNGLTVERDKVKVYAELAKLLFWNLFGFSVEVNDKESPEILGDFLVAWARFEKASLALTIRYFKPSSDRKRQPLSARVLGNLSFIDPSMVKELEEIRKIRNAVIHGSTDYKSALTHKMIERVNEATSKLEASL